MILNQEFGFDEVRWAISRATRSYDTKIAFLGAPVKTRLEPREVLFRLDSMAAGRQFLEVWRMREAVFRSLILQARSGSGGLRSAAENGLALPSRERLSVTEIELIQPVCAWVGAANSLFGKPGGSEQVFLPNLYARGNPRTSSCAKLRRTYWILSE
ncbi:MAG: hypothetical protein ABI165_21785 [Bryobacteraceae bacterium]